MKKKLILLTALCISLCAGCSGGAGQTSGTETADPAQTAAAAAGETASGETVIRDGNDIKITAVGFSESKEYYDEKILAMDIVNNTGKELSIYPQAASMGGEYRLKPYDE